MVRFKEADVVRCIDHTNKYFGYVGTVIGTAYSDIGVNFHDSSVKHRYSTKGKGYDILHECQLELYVEDKDTLPRGNQQPYNAKEDQNHLWNCIVSSSTR